MFQNHIENRNMFKNYKINIMKRVLIIIVAFLTIISCNNKMEESRLFIQSEKDTIELNSIYKAGLYIDHAETKLPDFYILRKNDTFLLPFFDEDNCAVFQAVGREVGNESYKGFVDFIDVNGNEKKQHFEILFYVQDSVIK